MLDVSNITDNTGAMGSANFFSIFALTKSGSGDLLMFQPLSLYSMVAASKLITSLLSGKVFSAVFHEFSFSIVKTQALLDCDSNASALS